MSNIQKFFAVSKFVRETMPAVVASAVLFASGAAAHDSLGPTMFTVDRGAVNSFTTPTSQVLSAPWVRKYFANAGQCLAFDMQPPVPSVDLELVVISPDPSIRYRNDDRGGPVPCSTCPLVKIDPTPVAGYYTVIANHWAGSPTTADFLLNVARQATGSSSCTTPTPPLP